MRHATFWQNGTLTDLGVPAGEQESIGCDVNNLNRVVGAVTHDFLVASAATWQNGSGRCCLQLSPAPRATRSNRSFGSKPQSSSTSAATSLR